MGGGRGRGQGTSTCTTIQYMIIPYTSCLHLSCSLSWSGDTSVATATIGLVTGGHGWRGGREQGREGGRGRGRKGGREIKEGGRDGREGGREGRKRGGERQVEEGTHVHVCVHT